jgi:cobalt-precorrin-5B (C1)-methyltransferase
VVQGLYGLPDHAMLDMGDFFGGMVKYLRRHPVARLTVGGGLGKLTKLAQGAMDLHSGRSQVDFSLLADWVGDARVTEANTALDAFGMVGRPLAEAVAARAVARVREAAGEGISCDVVVVDRGGEVLARAG